MLTLVMVILLWVMGEQSLWFKVAVTALYGLTWVAALVVPLEAVGFVALLVQAILGLALYFLLFGSRPGSRWRP
jgi:hypothetical protein